jgi:hypothetical protein
LKNVIPPFLLLFSFCFCKGQTIFDLSKITFKENINQLIGLNNASLKDGITEAKTIFGYERFESTDKTFLNFEGVKLDGALVNKKNKVVLHYSEKDSLLKMYDVEIYTAKECSALVKLLEQKLGESYLEENMKGFTDLEGRPYDSTIYNRVWQDKLNDVSYLLRHSYNDVKNRTNTYIWLTVINNKSEELYGDYLQHRAKKGIAYDFENFANDENKNGHVQYLTYLTKK